MWVLKRILRSFGMSLGAAVPLLFAGIAAVLIAEALGLAMPSGEVEAVAGAVVGLLGLATILTGIITSLAGGDWRFWRVAATLVAVFLFLVGFAGIAYLQDPAGFSVNP
jgi:hypothetical protein